ncbi:MAG: 1-acyl-sn-glycerol-3-phosphate acyltransferase [Alphaproteobacteria bacterium]|nr:1-acyl-sn-glycerol-3-phosphate acyltransferase [Alphaproteobacteria bacterium SS10]
MADQTTTVAGTEPRPRYSARTALFDAVFIVFNLSYALFASTRCVLFDGRYLQRDLLRYSQRISWMLEKILGITVEVTGAENIPDDRPVIMGSRHMSWLDPILSLQYARGVRGLAKKELFTIPFIGSVFRQMKNIKVDREAQKTEIGIHEIAEQVNSSTRPLMIYPEGTRCRQGEVRRLKSGIFRIHEASGVDVLPIRTNSGAHWRGPGHGSRPGVIRIEVLPPLPRTDDKDAFMEALSTTITNDRFDAE